MTAHGRAGQMGKRFAIVIGVAALGAAVIAAAASANFTSVNDPRGDTKCLHERGGDKPCSDSTRRNADIVRATAGHDGTRLKHTIRVVGNVHGGGLLINTDSDPVCELRFYIHRGVERNKVRDCSPGNNPTVDHARYDFHRHSVEISFSERSIGNPQSYGWSAYAAAGPMAGHALDDAPNPAGHHFRYIRHRLG